LFSHRSAFNRELNPLAVALHARERPFLDLTVSNPTAAKVPYDVPAILDALRDERALAYRPEPFGLRDARDALTSRIELAPPADRILLTASTSEAYGLLFKLLCDPGDQVAIPEPSYPLFEHLATLEHVTLVPYRLAYDGAWHVDLDSVRATVTEKTRALVVVSPNNPTGSFLKRDEHAALATLGLPLVSDEVFAEYAFGGGDDPRRMRTARERTEVLSFSMGGLSKSAGLPQMKLGWTCITGPSAEVREATERLEIIADAYLSPSAPVQIALPRLLDATASTQRAIRERVIANRQSLETLLARSAAPISLLHAEGGWTACARLPRTYPEEEWVLGLLDRADVLVQPGAFYDFADEPYIVLSLLVPPANFAEGTERLVDFVKRS
jgi:aspartate/methionine/tyrosine aminotransferase